MLELHYLSDYEEGKVLMNPNAESERRGHFSCSGKQIHLQVESEERKVLLLLDRKGRVCTSRKLKVCFVPRK